jgi:hypothetical protein
MSKFQKLSRAEMKNVLGGNLPVGGCTTIDGPCGTPGGNNGNPCANGGCKNIGSYTNYGSSGQISSITACDTSAAGYNPNCHNACYDNPGAEYWC